MQKKKSISFPPCLNALSNFNRVVTDLVRSDVMLSPKRLAYSAVLANAQIRCAIFEGRHRSEAQAKGK